MLRDEAAVATTGAVDVGTRFDENLDGSERICGATCGGEMHSGGAIKL